MVFSYLAALFAQSVFVKQVLGHAILRCAHAPQVGHPVGQLFDGLDLLVQEMCLEMVAQMWVIVIRAQLVQVQEGLVHALF